MPVVTFVDPDTVHNPAANVAPASWFTTIEADFRSIVGRVGASRSDNTAQDVSSPGTTTILLADVDWNNGMTTSTANTLIVPASYGGKYLIAAGLRIVSVPTGGNYVTTDVMVNGAIVHRCYARRSGASGTATAMSATFTISLAVADAITLSTEVSTNVSDADTELVATFPYIAAVWLSP